MLKAIAKMFMPGAKTLAGYAADGIAKAVNESKDETRAKVSKVATVALVASDIAGQLSRIVEDGQIDKLERDAIAALVEPIFQKVLELV